MVIVKLVISSVVVVFMLYKYMYFKYVYSCAISVSVCVKEVLIKISVQFRIRYAVEFLINCMSPRTTKGPKTYHTHIHTCVYIHVWLLALMYAKAKRSGQLNLAALSLLSSLRPPALIPNTSPARLNGFGFSPNTYIHT